MEETAEHEAGEGEPVGCSRHRATVQYHRLRLRLKRRREADGDKIAVIGSLGDASDRNRQKADCHQTVATRTSMTSQPISHLAWRAVANARSIERFVRRYRPGFQGVGAGYERS